MRKRIIWLFILILFSLLVVGGASGETSGFNTVEEALEDALFAYMRNVDEVGNWELGEINKDGEYAYSLAHHNENYVVEEGNLMILAKVGQDGLWYARTPFLDTPESYNIWLFEFPTSLFFGIREILLLSIH